MGLQFYYNFSHYLSLSIYIYVYIYIYSFNYGCVYAMHSINYYSFPYDEIKYSKTSRIWEISKFPFHVLGHRLQKHCHGVPGKGRATVMRAGIGTARTRVMNTRGPLAGEVNITKRLRCLPCCVVDRVDHVRRSILFQFLLFRSVIYQTLHLTDLSFFRCFLFGSDL